MRRIRWNWAFILVFLFCIRFISASDFKAKEPILITSAGQSGDVVMVKVLAKKQALQFSYDKLARPELLKDHKTLILVCGGSSKGLGAANIDKKEEFARVQALIKGAQDQKIKIIAMHVGGKARRGKLSDGFNTFAAENADCLIVVRGGDEDKLFSNVAKERKIPILLIERIMDAGDVMKRIFREEGQ